MPFCFIFCCVNRNLTSDSEVQNQIYRIISCIIPTFYTWIRHIWENKIITSSCFNHCFSIYFRFFGHSRLPEVIETSIKPQFQPSSTSWVNILTEATVMERPGLSKWNKNSWVNSLVNLSKCLRTSLLNNRSNHGISFEHCVNFNILPKSLLIRFKVWFFIVVVFSHHQL